MKTFYKLLSAFFVAIAGISTSHASKSDIPQPQAGVETKIGDLFYVLDTASKTAMVTYETMNPTNYNYLTEVEIPATVVDKGITYDVTSIGKEAFHDAENIVSLIMSDAITEIGYQAFAWCSSLVDIHLSTSITFLTEEAFRKCTALETIEIPSSVTIIDAECFDECSALKNVVLPNSVTYIDNSAFRDCYSLESIVLPESIKTLGVWVFENVNLDSLTCLATTPPDFYYEYPSDTYDYFDEEVYLNCKLYVPEESLSLYQTTYPWSGFANIQKIDSSNVKGLESEINGKVRIFDLSGRNILETQDASNVNEISNGLYIINGKKVMIGK